MAYNNWSVGGVSVPHVRTMKNDVKSAKITLSCSALDFNILSGDTDPRDEIARFEALVCQYITNNTLLNGGTKLQIGSGDYITVTDGTDTWTKCALEEIQISEDKKSLTRIDYDLVISYEKAATSGGSVVYVPPYNEYDNIDMYMSSDKAAWDCAYNNCSEIGYMQIVEQTNVKRVEIYGSACCGSEEFPNWIEMNGERVYWHYCQDVTWVGNELPFGWEKIIWNLDTPTDTIELQTSNHVSPAADLEDNLGCWLQYVRLVYV